MNELYLNQTDEHDDANNNTSTSTTSPRQHHPSHQSNNNNNDHHDDDNGDVVRATPLSRCEVRAPMLRAFVRRRPSRFVLTYCHERFPSQTIDTAFQSDETERARSGGKSERCVSSDQRRQRRDVSSLDSCRRRSRSCFVEMVR